MTITYRSVWNTYNSIRNCNINSYGDKDVEISRLDNISYWEEEEEAPAQRRDIIWTEQIIINKYCFIIGQYTQIIASFPRSRGKYFRKLFRIRLRRIEWQALRGWLRSAFWTYLSAEYLFPTSDCELQCVGSLLDGIALYSVRFLHCSMLNNSSEHRIKMVQQYNFMATLHDYMTSLWIVWHYKQVCSNT